MSAESVQVARPTEGLKDLDRVLDVVRALDGKCMYVTAMAGVPPEEQFEILVKAVPDGLWKVSYNHGQNWKRLTSRQMRIRYGAALFKYKE